jgi:hypothetical protein
MRWWKDYKRGRNARLADERKRVARDRLDAAAAVAAIQNELDRPTESGVVYYDEVPTWRRWFGHGGDAFLISTPLYKTPWNAIKEAPKMKPTPTQEQLERVYEAAKMVVMELECVENRRICPPTASHGEVALWAAVRAAVQPQWTVQSADLAYCVSCGKKYTELRCWNPVTAERIAGLLNADDAKKEGK